MQTLIEQMLTFESTGGTFEEFVKQRPNLRSAELLQLIAELQRASDASVRKPLETYLSAIPPNVRDHEFILEGLYSEILIREEHGEFPRESEYVARFPALKSEIHRQFQLHIALATPIAPRDDTAVDTDAERSRSTLPTPYPDFADIRIEGPCGSGGMSAVFLGHSITLARQVAVKTLSQSLVSNPAAVKRMEREARAIASVDHENIVKIYDVRRDSLNLPVIIMEYVGGGTLARKIAQGPISPRVAAALMAKVAEGVGVAHDAGLIHRDLKPANILMTKDGVPKVADFGLVRTESPLPIDESTIGNFVGTPTYVAPEQARAEQSRISAASDVYSLGVVLYEMLCGRPPFHAATAWEVVTDILNEDAPLLRQLNRRVPVDLETICSKCLEKSPDRRYADAGELQDDLNRYLTGRPIEAKPVSLVQRAFKWSRRNPVVALLGTLVVASLSAILGVTLVARNQVQHALFDTQVALTEAASQRDVAVSAMNDLVYKVHDTLTKREASVEALGEVLSSAIVGLQKIIDSDGGQADAKLTMADALNRYAFILTQQSKADEAITNYQRAIALAEERGTDKSKRLVALFYSNLGMCYGRLGQFDKQATECNRSQDVVKDLLKSLPEDIELRRLDCLNKKQLGGVRFATNDLAGALEFANEAKNNAMVLHSEIPQDERIIQLLVDLNTTIGDCNQYRGDFKSAESAYAECKELIELQNPSTTEDVQVRTRYYNTIAELATMKLYRRRYQDALSDLMTAKDGFQALVEAEPERVGFRLRLGGAHEKLSMAVRAVGDLEATVHHAKLSKENFQTAIDTNSSYDIQLTRIATAWSQIAGVQFRSGELEQAMESNQRIVTSLEPIAARFQMQKTVSNIEQTIQLFAGAIGLESSAAPSDIAKFKAAYEVICAAQVGNLAPFLEAQSSLKNDLQEAITPALKLLLHEGFATNLGQLYSFQKKAGAPSEQLLQTASQCIEAIQKYEALPDGDANFHTLEASFIDLRESAEFAVAFPVL